MAKLTPARVRWSQALTKSQSVPPAVGYLSGREMHVAAMVARGFSNREIAKALSIGPRTVETHVQHVLKKLSFHTRAQIAAWAVARGLSRPP